MIFVNNEVLLETKMDLNEFVDKMQGEIYNENSKIIINCVIEFLYDIWDRSEKLSVMMRKKISESLVPVVVVDIKETADLTKLDIRAMSMNEQFEPKKADEMAFNDLCSRYFKGFKPLYDRFAEMDLD